MDISWISAQAKDIHGFFTSIFFALATVLLLVGVLVEYFKMPLGGAPSFSQLLGRVLVATILLVAYPEISNNVAALVDAISERLGSLNSFSNVLDVASKALKEHSWSWTSIGDSLLSVISYGAYLILYITVFFFDAAIVYCLTLLYVFSPLMIAFFILPATASITGGLFRTLFEVGAWKIVWSVLGTLLWSTALNNFQNGSQGNFITLVALSLMLAFSVLLTPIVVRSLISGALASVASQTAGLAAVGLSAGFLAPHAIAGLTSAGTRKAAVGGAKMAAQGYKHTKTFASRAHSKFKSKLVASRSPNKTIEDEKSE